MRTLSLMQQALGPQQWEALPAPLKTHYRLKPHTTHGGLSIAYPRFMSPLLHALRRFGALVNRRGEAVPTAVAKHMADDTQHWRRSIRFADGQEIIFASQWQAEGGNRLTEYVNRHLGLCMAVKVENDTLIYEGCHFVLRVGALKLRLPENLLLGHTHIVERAIDDQNFVMDFRVTHPIFGEVYRYGGKFSI